MGMAGTKVMKKLKRTGQRSLLLSVVLMYLVSGCGKPASTTEAIKASDGDQTAQNNVIENDIAIIDVSEGPYTENIVAVVKNDEPYILVDILPEVNNFNKHPAGSQKVYLCMRALQICLQAIEKKEEFKDRNDFKVRMIMVSTSDEYGRGNWAMAPELAVFMIPRPKVPLDKIGALRGEELTSCFSELNFNAKYIK